MRGQIMIQVLLKVAAPDVLCEFFKIWNHERINYFRSLRLQVLDGFFRQSFYLRISRWSINIFSENADAGATKAILIEKLGVVLWDFAFRKFGHGIGRIVSRNHFEHAHRIFHAARHRPAYVVSDIQGNDSIAAGEAQSWPDTDKRIMRRRTT